MKYKVFISYKHASNGSLHAVALEKSLKTYAKPFLSPPMKVFRDEKHLVPGLDLPRVIENALVDSEYLIFLADASSAESPWCKDELLYWCNNLARRNKLIIVHIGDTIAVQPDSKKIDWTNTNALPRLLMDYIEKVPFYSNMEWAVKDIDRDLQNPDYKSQVNTLVAKLRGVTPESLNDESIRVYRRNIRLRNTAIVALSVMLAISILTSVYAFNQRTIAKKETENANTQKIIANQERDKADKQADIANREKQNADRQRDTANAQKKKAEEQEAIAINYANSLEKKNYASQIANRALQWQNRNPTLSLRLLQKSYQIGNDLGVLQSMNNLYAAAAFYSKKIPVDKQITDFKIADKTGHIIMAMGNDILLMDNSGKILNTYKEAHKKRVLGLAIAPDNSFFISIGDDSLMIKWRFNALSPVFKKKIPERRITAVKISNKNYIAIGVSSRQAFVFSPEGTQTKVLHAKQGNIMSLEFSPDGNQVITGSSTGFNEPDRCFFSKVWDIAGTADSAKQVFTLRHGEIVLSVDYDPLGEILLTGGGDGRVKMWNAKTGTLIKELFASNNLMSENNEMYVNHVSFSPDGKYILSSGNDNSILLWSRDGSPLKNLVLYEGSVNDIRIGFNKKSNQIITSARNDKHLVFWDVDDLPATLYGDNDAMNVAVSYSAKFVLSGGFAAKLFDVAKQKIVWTRMLVGIREMGFLGDDFYFINSYDSLYLYRSSDRKHIKTIPQARIAVHAIDSTKAFILSNNGDVNLFDFRRERMIKLFNLKAYNDIRDILFDHNRNLFIIGKENGSLEWYSLEGRLHKQIKNAHDKAIMNLSIAKDGAVLSCGLDDKIKYWAPGGKLLSTVTLPRLVKAIVSPNSDLIVANTPDELFYYDTGGHVIGRTYGNLTPGFSYSFSADGQFLILGRHGVVPKKIIIRKSPMGLQKFLNSRSLFSFSDQELKSSDFMIYK